MLSDHFVCSFHTFIIVCWRNEKKRVFRWFIKAESCGKKQNVKKTLNLPSVLWVRNTNMIRVFVLPGVVQLQSGHREPGTKLTAQLR